jgi:hypothetical protein
MVVGPILYDINSFTRFPYPNFECVSSCNEISKEKKERKLALVVATSQNSRVE